MKFVSNARRTMAGLLAGVVFGLIVSSPTASALGLSPVLSFVSPGPGSNVSGTVTFAAAADAEGLVSLQFKVDGNDFGSPITAGSCRLDFNTSVVSDGPHTVQAVGQDQFGAMTVSTPITMYVNNSSPSVGGISLYNVTSSSATIGWTTALPSDSQVEFGPTSAYGSMTVRDWTQVISHAQTLNGLAASSVYHFRVYSVGQNGIVSVSIDFSFSTASVTPNPNPTPTPTPTPNPNPTPTPTPTPTPNPNPTPRPPSPTPTPTPPVLSPTPTPIVGTQTRHTSALPNVRRQTPQVVLTPDPGSAVSAGDRVQQPRLTTSSSGAAASRTGTSSVAPRSATAPVTGDAVTPKSAPASKAVVVAAASASSGVPCTEPDPFKAKGGVGLCVDGRWVSLWKPASGGKKE